MSFPDHPLGPPPASPTGTMIPRQPISREGEAARRDASVNQPTMPRREAPNRPFNRPPSAPDQLSIARQPVSMDRRPVEKEGFTGKEPTTAPKPMMQSQGMSREQLGYQQGSTSGTVRSNRPGAVGNIASDKEQPGRQPLLPRPALRGTQDHQERGGGQYRREAELEKAGGGAAPQKG
jgi:hypothetical protein